ncbi:hypothetical protein QF035_000747 [Streptomyces umbrinus]|uniref:Uncharacterized protein n=1 Tax=Streptomyces umbrinus TaxID=67370 RepID=A0ABU0SHW5_9ACTN|nr:hypothetical protein [Streptomyces umbrinus]MDQ1023165.1 hypothetical protein [Streptomyces umbrinus]
MALIEPSATTEVFGLVSGGDPCATPVVCDTREDLGDREGFAGERAVGGTVGESDFRHERGGDLVL